MAALTVDFRKHSGPTPADDMAAQIITDCGNFTLDFKQHGFCASPLFLQTLGPWFPNEMQNLLSSEKRALDHWVLFLHSPGKMLLTLSLVQKCLGSPFPEDVWAWWLLMHWLQLQSTPCEARTSVWISFAWQYSQACSHPCCLCTFSYPNSSFQSTLHSICFDTALCKQPHLSVMTLCDFVEGINVRLLDHCQVSSLPHYCDFKEQEIPGIYTVGMVINWKSNVNILIFWDTDFWLSWAVSSNHQN